MLSSFQPSTKLGLHIPSLSHLLASTTLVLCCLLLPTIAAAQKDCSKSSTGLIPLTEMLPGETYFGQDGGLYGAHSDLRPSQHEATGLFLS